MLRYLSALDVKSSGITIGQLLPRLHIFCLTYMAVGFIKLNVFTGWTQSWTTQGRQAPATSRLLLVLISFLLVASDSFICVSSGSGAGSSQEVERGSGCDQRQELEENRGGAQAFRWDD